MIKKFITFFLSFCLMLVLANFNNVNAKELNVSDNISQDTVITNDNVLDVLEYLNIDSKDFIRTDSSEIKDGTKTVGDLKMALEEAKKIPKEIYITENEDGIDYSKYFRSGSRSSGTKTLYRSSTPSGGYTFTYSASASYANGKWVKTFGGNVSVDSDLLVPVYKIGTVDSLVTSCTSTNVNLKTRFQLNVYFGVMDVGLIKASSNWVNANINWGSSYIPK